MQVALDQQAYLTGRVKRMMEWSLEEAAPALLEAELCTKEELEQILRDMRAAAEDEQVLCVAPRLTSVAARQPAACQP